MNTVYLVRNKDGRWLGWSGQWGKISRAKLFDQDYEGYLNDRPDIGLTWVRFEEAPF